MKRLFFALFLLIAQNCFAAMSASITWEFSSTATANMVNGGGFVTGASGTDYSLQNSAQWTTTDLACTAASTTITSATGGFTSAAVGNVIHITAGTNFTVGWYEITAFTDGNTLTVDRSPAPSLNGSGGTFYIGGALNVGGSLEDDFFEQCVAGQIVYFKGAVTYTLSEAVTIITDGTSSLFITVEGYNATRGDNPTGANRPTIAIGGNNLTPGDYFLWKNFIMTGTSASGFQPGLGSVIDNIKFTNSSVTAGRFAFTMNGNVILFTNSEGISTNGTAMAVGSTTSNVYGCYFHDSVWGISISTGSTDIAFCLIESNSSGAITITSTATKRNIYNNTLYGDASPTGTGIDIAAGVINVKFYNNIIANFATGITRATASADSITGDYNNFYGNTTNRTNVAVGDHDTALDPGFTDAANADFRVGANMKATAFPGTFPGAGASCIGYLDQGAVQRVEPTGGTSNDVFGIM